MNWNDPIILTGIIAGIAAVFGYARNHIKKCEEDRESLNNKIIELIKRTATLEAALGIATRDCPLPSCPRREAMEETAHMKILPFV